MNTRINYFVTSLVISLISSLAYGQFQGPGSVNAPLTIKEVKENAFRLDWSDTQVRIRGNIIEQIKYDTYLFRDTTGTIRIEVEDGALPRRPFNDRTELVIVGEVEYFWLFGKYIWVHQVIFP